MAAKKNSRAKAVAKRPAKKNVVKAKAKVKAKAPLAKVSARPKPKTLAMKTRKTPETLRLRAFAPSLTVNDLAKSMAFYTDGLGFVVSQRWPGPDGVLRGVMLKAGASELGISQDDWKAGTDRKKGVGSRLFLDTAQDVDAIASRLKAAGYSLSEEPSDNAQWGIRSFSVDDPDGFHLTITRDL